MQVNIPDSGFFTVDVSYGDTSPPAPSIYRVTIRLAGVGLFTRSYTDDPTLLDLYHEAVRKGIADSMVDHYAPDADNAKEKCMNAFAEKLKEILSRADPMSRY